MELKSVRTVEVAGPEPAVRLVGEIAYDDRRDQTEELWFEVGRDLGDGLSRSGNPWLLSLLPLAAYLGEPLRLRLPVDRLLGRNATEIMAIWKAWYPRFRPVEVVARVEDRGIETAGKRSAAFFSGGVDSFFAILGRQDSTAVSLPVDELLAVHGFDIPLANAEAFRRHAASLARTAEALGKPLFSVATNLRETRLREVPWADVMHGCALAAVGLVLERRYDLLVIAAAADYAHVEPNGSHPMLDPLFSTWQTRVLHEGASANRCQKLEALSRSELVRQGLHVCWRIRSERNCGECEKCLRNMAILEVLGVLKDCPAFEGKALALDRLSRIYHSGNWNAHTYGAIRAMAAQRGRHDIVAAIDRSFRRSKTVRRALAFSAWLSGRRLLWRGGRRLRQWTLARAVT